LCASNSINVGRRWVFCQMSFGCKEPAGHAPFLNNALVHTACPIALWVGDLASAERFLALLRDHLAQHQMTVMNPL
jgi:hypothetical protein